MYTTKTLCYNLSVFPQTHTISILTEGSTSHHEERYISAPCHSEKKKNRVSRTFSISIGAQDSSQQKAQREKVPDSCLKSRSSERAGNLTGYSAPGFAQTESWCGYCMLWMTRTPSSSASLSEKNRAKLTYESAAEEYSVKHSDTYHRISIPAFR